ncbi:MAG TPA: ABC transporter substrate-binding protein [Chloroflexota bacterium]|nr:ABC transporter substrate-binding protein [Chloroflexota bacterium]
MLLEVCPPRRWWSVLLLIMALFTACAEPAPGAPTGQSGKVPGTTAAKRATTITVAVAGNVPNMGLVGLASTTTGGWFSIAEVHSNALITSDVHSRQPVGRLIDRVPSLDNGDISLLPDGRMRVIYHVRPGVTWHDGQPFTAQDLVFSYRFNTDAGIPTIQSDVTRMLASAEAPDDATFVLNFKGPYYRADQLGLRMFWPYPRHILEPAYERYLESTNPDDIVNLPYWTSEYIHLGPFRLTSFDSAGPIEFQAYDGYFLGRPKVDTIRVLVFSDLNTLYANIQSGTVDIVPETVLQPELGFQLMDQWASTGGGSVFVTKSAQRFLSPQERPEVQSEPSMSDFRVRAALYEGLDRVALSEGLQAGHGELAAWALLWEGEPLYDATKDAFRRYAYDPERAQATLREAGWVAGPDGALRSSADGRRMRTSITATPGRIEREANAFADYWRRLGIDVEQITVPAAQIRNAETRALYPGWEASAQGGGDEILGRLEGPAASPQNRWTGNRGGYDDPRAQELIASFRSSLRRDDQLQAMKAISDFVADTLPMLILFSTAEHLVVRKGVHALDDHDGGDSAARPYGTYSRNAHLWEGE